MREERREREGGEEGGKREEKGREKRREGREGTKLMIQLWPDSVHTLLGVVGFILSCEGGGEYLAKPMKLAKLAK